MGHNRFSIEWLHNATKGPLNRKLRSFNTWVQLPDAPIGFIMKKVFFTLVLMLCVEGSTTSNINFQKNENHYCTVQTQRDHALECATRIFPLNEIVIYIIDTAIEEEVDPIEVLAFIKIENPKLFEKAKNENVVYKKIYDEKKKIYINKKFVLSYDIGIGQLNSKYLSEYEWFYWTNKDEKEKFDPENYKHNIKVAIRIFKTLKRELKNKSSAAMAYNAGIGSVLKNDIPQTTLYFYLPQYLNNLEKMGVSR